MIKELQDIFPRMTERKIWKILLTIKFRYKTYWTIGLSRLEASRFGTSERQMQAFIRYLRDINAINKVWMIMALWTGRKCNVYSLSLWFIEWLEEVKDFVKKVFTYIDPVAYVKSKFKVKRKYWILKFKVDGERYQISERGRFKGKIYDIANNCIINPLSLW